MRSPRAERCRKGFTLIEVLIALGLFALIGVAGFTLLNSVLRTQDATDTRLGRMAEAVAGEPRKAAGPALAHRGEFEHAPDRLALALRG